MSDVLVESRIAEESQAPTPSFHYLCSRMITAVVASVHSMAADPAVQEVFGQNWAVRSSVLAEHSLTRFRAANTQVVFGDLVVAARPEEDRVRLALSARDEAGELAWSREIDIEGGLADPARVVEALQGMVTECLAGYAAQCDPEEAADAAPAPGP